MLSDFYTTQEWGEDEVSQVWDFSEMELSHILCPDCNAPLYIAYFGNSPDDYYSALICKECNYFEQE